MIYCIFYSFAAILLHKRIPRKKRLKDPFVSAHNKYDVPFGWPEAPEGCKVGGGDG
jgi:hypothetical protein